MNGKVMEKISKLQIRSGVLYDETWFFPEMKCRNLLKLNIFYT